MAASHTDGEGSEVPSTKTPSRRGIPDRVHRRAPSSSITAAAAEFQLLRFGVWIRTARRPTAAATRSVLSASSGSASRVNTTGRFEFTRPTLMLQSPGSQSDTAPVWMAASLGIRPRAGDANRPRQPWLRQKTVDATQKGRPSPGGEEARVVVYQPRGVGLMHTRPKPSEANYTHGEASWRKSLAARKTTFFL